MDVPLNHWAYDAIGQLAASGVLSGYPDGTYKGKQPTTRYEMASALARALALTDVTKASRQDVEVLKRLVVEFKDELDALGVKTEGLTGRVSAMEERLGGWKIGGELRIDIEDWDDDMNGTLELTMARLEFHRWFGEDEGIYLYARLEEDEDVMIFDKFYADVPFLWGSSITVGRLDRDFEGEYRFQTGGVTDIANEAWMTDRTFDGFAFDKSFSLGSFHFYAARAEFPGMAPEEALDLWDFNAFASLQFSEQLGFDLGVQYLLGDDGSVIEDVMGLGLYDMKANHVLTLYGGLRFNFNPNLTFKALYAYQDTDFEISPAGTGVWTSSDEDSTSAWKVIVDVKQDLLKFTSLWLEYSHLDEGFYIPYNNTALTLVDDDRWNTVDGGAGVSEHDIDIWRVGAVQEWNEKWSTWFYVAGHTLKGVDAPDFKGMQWGLGVEHRYNENVAFALNYIRMDWNDDASDNGYQDQYSVQLRTTVTF
jgi:opacity protein-like surface antigen